MVVSVRINLAAYTHLPRVSFLTNAKSLAFERPALFYYLE